MTRPTTPAAPSSTMTVSELETDVVVAAVRHPADDVVELTLALAREMATEEGEGVTAAGKLPEPTLPPPGSWVSVIQRAGRLHAAEARVLEARAEGFAALDVDGGCSDVAFPTGGTLPHAALLLVSELVYQFRPEEDPVPIPWASVRTQATARSTPGAAARAASTSPSSIRWPRTLTWSSARLT